MEILKKIRKQNNLNQADVAKYLGIAVSSYSM
ncbi:MAG: helix-turn-helix domain-containing protein, partial [bacterium]